MNSNSKKSGVFVSNGERSVELEIGWYKEWSCENVYSWHFFGPVEQWRGVGPYVDLLVLDHEPDVNERAEIVKRFADAIAPDGTKGLVSTL